MSGETTNKLLLIIVVGLFIFMSFILVYIFGPIMILLLVLIFGPILILYGDFLEEREKEAKKMKRCVICGLKLFKDKESCVKCAGKDHNFAIWEQYWMRFGG
ncbi:MAG: hypothetical protein ACFE68_05585 [Candidatus Hodarchaeota archaeon]